MGNFLFKNTIENVKHTIEEKLQTMQENQKAAALKQRQLQLAMQFSMGKERFLWFQAFYLPLVVILPIAAIKRRNPSAIIPLYPLTFGYLYQYDMYYNNKQERVRSMAEKLLLDEPELFIVPEHSGFVTQDEYRKLLNIKKKN